ncbi:MAG: sigma 54-interacting transcriptional regulator, partial [Phycisphaerae bacterium]|nr:sigma 54-interacting transcriptional regulator [Phycisphaerae bacterium]
MRALNTSSSNKMAEEGKGRDAISIKRVAAEEVYENASIDDGVPIEFMGMVTAHPALKDIFAKITIAAKSDLTILIEGETGTGKELVANALH